MAANFRIVSSTSTTVTIRVTPDSSYYFYRVMAWVAGDPSNVCYEGRTSIFAEYDIVIGGLSPATLYAISVEYGSSMSGPWTSVGEQLAQTASEGDLIYGIALIFEGNGSTLQVPAPVVVQQALSEPNTNLFLKAIIPSTTPIWEGHTFCGWRYTYSDGSTKTFKPGAEFEGYATVDPFPTYTLVAIWDETPEGSAWIYLRGQYIGGSYVSGWVRAVPWIYTGGRWHAAIPWVYTGGRWRETG